MCAMDLMNANKSCTLCEKGSGAKQPEIKQSQIFRSFPLKNMFSYTSVQVENEPSMCILKN